MAGGSLSLHMENSSLMMKAMWMGSVEKGTETSDAM